MSARPLGQSAAMIFIPYRLPEGAEARGYADWLRAVDNPFFNAIPGIHHYANWKRAEMLAGQAPGWDWFDFKGLTFPEDLERVWFNPELDQFRKGWLELWGYGAGEPRERPAFLGYSYLFTLTHASAEPGETGVICCGKGAPPDDGDLVYQRTGFLPKHFALDASSRSAEEPWLLKTLDHDPLGFDWIRVSSGRDCCGRCEFSFAANRIAAPDGSRQEPASP